MKKTAINSANKHNNYISRIRYQKEESVLEYKKYGKRLCISIRGI